MKNKLIKELYDCFYVPPELPAQKQEIEECHQALIEALEKPERRLVLQIIDAKDRIVEDTSIDSFISGFTLAWKLSAELNNYENERYILNLLYEVYTTYFNSVPHASIKSEFRYALCWVDEALYMLTLMSES